MCVTTIGVLVYAPEIFKLCGYGDKSASIATITLGIIKVVTTSITLSLVDRVGRRRLLMVGVVGMMISLAALSVILSNRLGLLVLNDVICYHTYY